MTICHFTTVHRPDDTRVRHKQCGTLLDENYEVVLFARSSSELPEADDAVDRSPIPDFSNKVRRLLYQPRLLVDLVRVRADVYQTHDPELIPLLLLLRALGKKVILDIHEDLAGLATSRAYVSGRWARGVGRMLSLLERLACRYCNAVIVARPPVSERLQELRSDVVCIRNYPQQSELAPPPALEEYVGRKRLVGYLGSLSLERGAKELRLLAQVDDIELQVGGPANDRAAREAMETLCAPSAYLGEVPRSEVRGLLGSWRVGLALLHDTPIYRYEIPTKLYEYMAAGLPFVASDLPSNRELVETVPAGLLVDPLDADAVHQAISSLLNDPERAFEMGRLGYEHVHRNLTWSSEGHAYLECIRRVAVSP
jgi:glycosyltransferase involved in cell wall biosynthesis